MSRLLDAIERTLRVEASRVAVLSLEGTRLMANASFAEVDAASLRCRAVLSAAGVGPGDRVVIALPRSLEGIEWIAATLRAGAVAVPVDVAAKAEEIEHVVRNSTARLAIVGDDAGPGWERVAIERRSGSSATVGAPSLELRPSSGSRGIGPPAVEESDPALLVYTSGTTGRPKGVILSHSALFSNLTALATLWQWTRADRLLLTLPCFHLHGLALGCVAPLLIGSSVALAENFDAENVAAQIGVACATMFFGVPTMYARLAASRSARAADLTSVRLWVSGSAPLAAETAERFFSRFGHRIVERFGMSEALFVLSTRPGVERPGWVGWPVGGARCRIVRSTDARPLEDCGADEPGELVLQGESLFSGYWSDPEATASAFVDGWFRTGDVAAFGPDGCVRIEGRLSTDIIKTRGFKVGALEIEGVLLAIPGVREAAVVGLPDPDVGQRIAAFVVLAAGDAPSLEKIDAHCRDRLSRHKVPQRIIVVDDLPRVGPGKVDKRALMQTPPAQ